MKPRVLLFDIETSYIVARLWRTGKQYVTHEQIVKDQKSGIICISYKWLGERDIHTLDWGLNAQNSAKVVEAFSKVVESADVVVGHNADSFDIKHINTQRLLAGQPPIAWPTSEDTLKQLRKHFALPSYRLDYIAKLLTGSGKSPMNFQDWIDVVEGKSAKALEKMIRYNRRDVDKLSKVFAKVSKFFTPKAHRGLLMGKDRHTCPHCGSVNSRVHDYKTTLTRRYQRRKCMSCAHSFIGPSL